MARRGPKPKHLTLVDAVGAVDEDARAVESGEYVCPLELTESQAPIWENVVGQLKSLGLMRQVFWPTVYGLVVALDSLQECNRAMSTLTVKGSNGYEKKHPAATVANQSLTQIRTYSAELGLTPSALAKIGPPKDAKPSKLDKLIKGA